jgi:hypothetical protein
LLASIATSNRIGTGRLSVFAEERSFYMPGRGRRGSFPKPKSKCSICKERDAFVRFVHGGAEVQEPWCSHCKLLADRGVITLPGTPPPKAYAKGGKQ